MGWNTALRPTGPVARLAIALVGTLLCVGLATAAQEEKNPPAVPSGLVEETGVRLMLLDVEVTDKEGRPIRGLTKEDFEVWLNGRKRTLYSVDDLCVCEAGPLGTDDTGEPDASIGEVSVAESIPDDATAPPEVQGDAPPNPSEVVRFVLYLDFSQLQLDGRERAIAEARRWVREAMQDGDETMIAGYATVPGLREIVPFTRDRQALLDGLDECEQDMTMVDSFPGALDSRLRDLETCCDPSPPECCCDCLQREYGRQEYRHGRHALKALEQLLMSLEGVPGRKALVLFHQNGTLFPARVYENPDLPPDLSLQFRVGEHNTLLDEVAAEATLARTVVHVAYSGRQFQFADPLTDLNIGLGANLADFTGGTYNRTSGQLPGLIDRAGRGCACVYRIGLEPPDKSASPYRAKIAVRERVLDHRYRVQYLGRFDRWLRDAQAVLRSPESAADLRVGVAIVPLRVARKGGWDVTVRVALDLDSLSLIPQEGKHQGDWEVGALLNREPTGKSWDMLGMSHVRSGDAEIGEAFVVHERTIEGLKPGSYRLGAFVRDRLANGFGGAQATIDLPAPDKSGIAGPVAVRRERSYLRSTLPLWAGGKKIDSEPGRAQKGPLPLAGAPVARGESLDMLSWLCPGKQESEVTGVVGYVSHDGRPMFRLENAEVTSIGACHRMSETIDTRPLVPGRYTYHIRWEPKGKEPLAAEAVFDVAALDPTQEAAAVDTEVVPAAGNP